MNRDGEAAREVLGDFAESERSTPRKFRYLLFRHFHRTVRGEQYNKIVGELRDMRRETAELVR